MSWYFDAVIPAHSDNNEAARLLFLARDGALEQAGEWSEETRHQAQEAVNLGSRLATSGALGHGGMLVTCSGHANPGHDPSQALTTDSVSIVCRQQHPPAPA